MIKKLFSIFAVIFALMATAKADVMPYYVGSINQNSIGVYQASNNIKVYQAPNENSKLLLNINWDAKNFNCSDISASNFFVVFLPLKDLAFLSVIDENDNEDWVQISYNQNGLKTGWVKKEDEYRFLNWRTFLNLYGRKYGLYYMKDAPESSKIVYGSAADDAKSIGKITLAQSLKLTNISGNWLLTVVLDIDRTSKVGWIKWRDISGQIYLFPNIK